MDEYMVFHTEWIIAANGMEAERRYAFLLSILKYGLLGIVSDREKDPEMYEMLVPIMRRIDEDKELQPDEQ